MTIQWAGSLSRGRMSRASWADAKFLLRDAAAKRAGVAMPLLRGSLIDSHSRYAWAKLYTNKVAVMAVQTLNNEVLPTFEKHGAVSDTILSDNDREFCGDADQHP